MWRYDSKEWWWQQGSFQEPVTPPVADSQDSPVVCLQLNVEWLPLVLGSLMQLVQESTWNVPSGPLLQEIQARVTDLMGIWGNAGACVAPQFRFTVACGLEYSLDGGATFLPFVGWTTYFQQCVRANQAYVLMTDGLVDPPVPLWNATGTDWVYGD